VTPCCGVLPLPLSLQFDEAHSERHFSLDLPPADAGARALVSGGATRRAAGDVFCAGGRGSRARVRVLPTAVDAEEGGTHSTPCRGDPDFLPRVARAALTSNPHHSPRSIDVPGFLPAHCARPASPTSTAVVECTIPRDMTIERSRRRRSTAPARGVGRHGETRCDHLHDTVSRYDRDAKRLELLLTCPVCETEKVIHSLAYEPRFEPSWQAPTHSARARPRPWTRSTAQRGRHGRVEALPRPPRGASGLRQSTLEITFLETDAEANRSRSAGSGDATDRPEPIRDNANPVRSRERG
jgi:hypothetical protein